tara:strand:- start:582 stop:770 length:189 start_codon:yes stop_codon:yes gene_type:complete
MAHEFKVRVGGNIETYDDYDNIPDSLTEIVYFNPDQTGLSDAQIIEWSRKYKELQDIAEGNQ